ncbi:RNA-binding motif protein, X-linked 2 [Chelonia mydas]|uniref:RNA-binding motif protein, X-linked 2 n=1 Tax=Chelonia mydas TaxID=8469 RepID=M7B957_CHEMY|nr:RNA-binding motif protein, X-linked 2 [Chelonia mydas]
MGAVWSPLTKVKLINELNQREAELGVQEKVSWHAEYSDSAWIFVGGLPYELTEGDIICVFSQYGEIVNINLVRDKKTGKSKGFCFICYEDQRSTILAVDNFNGIKVVPAAEMLPPKSGSGKKCRRRNAAEKRQRFLAAFRRRGVLREHKNALTGELPPTAWIKKEKEDSAYDQYANPRQQSRNGSGRKHASRTYLEEEPEQEQCRKRGVERRGDKGHQEQKGLSSAWKEEKAEDKNRKGEGRSSRQEECLGTRSRERWPGPIMPGKESCLALGTPATIDLLVLWLQAEQYSRLLVLPVEKYGG